MNGDNLWSNSATGDSGSLGGIYYIGLSLRIASRVNGLHSDGATFPSGRK